MNPFVDRSMALAIALLATALALSGCMSPRERAMQAEMAGEMDSAINFYRTAAAQGDKLALYNAGRLLVASDSPSRRSEGLAILAQCANPEAAGFYYVQKDLEAAKFVALATLGALFEEGLVVPRDTMLAGYFYRRAQEEERNLGNWLSDNRRGPTTEPVFSACASTADGLSRMEDLGYAGERYTWPEINALLADEPSQADAGKLRYKILSSSFDSSSETAVYEYEITQGDYNLQVDRILIREMCRKVKVEYCDRHPEVEPGDVHAAPTSSSTTGNRGACTVSVFVLKPTELFYSATTRKGTLTIRTNGRNLDDAVSWALKNLETLVASQNVVLTVGAKPPSGARFKPLDYELVDKGARLKVKFETRQ